MDGILSSCVSDGNNLFVCETSSIPAICRQTLRKVCGYCELIRNGIFSSEEKEMPTQCNCPVRGMPVVRLGQKRGLSGGLTEAFLYRMLELRLECDWRRERGQWRSRSRAPGEGAGCVRSAGTRSLRSEPRRTALMGTVGGDRVEGRIHSP